MIKIFPVATVHLSCVTAAFAQVTITSYQSLPTTSSCVSIDVPEGAVPGTMVEFGGTATDGTVNALAVDFNDVVSIFEVVHQELDITINYKGYPSIGMQNIAAIDWSDATNCDLLSESVLNLQDFIIFANFSVPSVGRTDQFALVTVFVMGGTDAQVSINLGDGSLSVPTCEVSSSLSELTYNFTYENAGSFDSVLNAYNYVTDITETHTISVYEPIDDLTLTGSTQALVPPGNVQFTVSAGDDQGSVENFVCVWNMGSNYEDNAMDVSLLDSETPHEVTFVYEQDDVGMQTVSVSCSNVVSSQVVTLDVDVIWDCVTLGDLTCDTSRLWNHSITCELDVDRFGTGACFEWDMGDGKPLVYYQDGNCVVNVPTASPVYVQVIWRNYK